MSKPKTLPVKLVGVQFTRNFLLPQGRKEESSFAAASDSEKDVIKAAKTVPGIGWGIGAMCKIYRVELDGTRVYLFSLMSQVRAAASPGKFSARALATPEVVYDESAGGW